MKRYTGHGVTRTDLVVVGMSAGRAERLQRAELVVSLQLKLIQLSVEQNITPGQFRSVTSGRYGSGIDQVFIGRWRVRSAQNKLTPVRQLQANRGEANLEQYHPSLSGD